LSYLEGSLEIMTNSPLHEELKTTIAMLLETYFQVIRTRFHGIGSATFRKATKQHGLEPDECYCLGQKKEISDLAIEVVVSQGLVDTLEIYRGLGIAEVWVWQAGTFTLYHLRAAGYEPVSASELLPNCDINLLARYVKPEEQFDAVMLFRAALQGQSVC